MLRHLLIILSIVFTASLYSEENETENSAEQSTENQSSSNPTNSEKDTNPTDTSQLNETTQESEPPKEYVTPDKAKERNSDVARYLKAFQRENELIEISGKSGNMHGLYLPENTGQPQGGILILHDIAQHAHWPNTVTPIREYLPDHGWNTLSIFFDEYIKKPLPKVEPFQFSQVANESSNITGSENTDPDNTNSEKLAGNEESILENEQPETSNSNEIEQPIEDANFANDNQGTSQEDALGQIADNLGDIPDFTPEITQEVLEQPAIPVEDTFIENMIQRTEDGLNQLNKMGQFNIAIIANGYSANWAAKMLEARLNGNNIGYALILIDAKSSDYPAIDLNESLSKLDIPMLDIITNDAPEHLRTSKARKGAMLRNQNLKYMQIYLPAIKISLNATDNMISRRIRGWLRTHAAGEEVAVKVNNNL